MAYGTDSFYSNQKLTDTTIPPVSASVSREFLSFCFWVLGGPALADTYIPGERLMCYGDLTGI
jgi:hypothetical protein